MGWRGARAIQKLEYMCLVEIDDNSRLKMNDCLSNLGREIAHQQLCGRPYLPCRVWRPNEAANFLEGLLPLPENTKTRGIIEGARMNNRHFGSKRMKTYTFSSFKLELLHVNGDLDYGILSDRLDDLVWFRWENCPHISIALPEMNNLRVLELVKGNLETLFHLPAQLREVRVKKCRELVEIPPAFKSLIQLEKMTLMNLMIHPELFEEINSLEQLGFENCRNLRHLPTQTTCQVFLRKLNLLGTSLEQLPNDIDQWTKLELLYIESPFLTSLPLCLGNMRCVTEIVLFNCPQLMSYPLLQHLGISYDPNLQDTADLTTLYIYGRQITDTKSVFSTSEPYTAFCGNSLRLELEILVEDLVLQKAILDKFLTFFIDSKSMSMMREFVSKKKCRVKPKEEGHVPKEPLPMHFVLTVPSTISPLQNLGITLFKKKQVANEHRVDEKNTANKRQPFAFPREKFGRNGIQKPVPNVSLSLAMKEWDTQICVGEIAQREAENLFNSALKPGSHVEEENNRFMK
ncbi:hypothetical protein KI387_033254, partial [Taxus chinensis]